MAPQFWIFVYVWAANANISAGQTAQNSKLWHQYMLSFIRYPLLRELHCNAAFSGEQDSFFRIGAYLWKLLVLFWNPTEVRALAAPSIFKGLQSYFNNFSLSTEHAHGSLFEDFFVFFKWICIGTYVSNLTQFFPQWLPIKMVSNEAISIFVGYCKKLETRCIVG